MEIEIDKLTAIILIIMLIILPMSTATVLSIIKIVKERLEPYKAFKTTQEPLGNVIKTKSMHYGIPSRSTVLNIAEFNQSLYMKADLLGSLLIPLKEIKKAEVQDLKGTHKVVRIHYKNPGIKTFTLAMKLEEWMQFPGLSQLAKPVEQLQAIEKDNQAQKWEMDPQSKRSFTILAAASMASSVVMVLAVYYLTQNS
jgi:hypothetical protein